MRLFAYLASGIAALVLAVSGSAALAVGVQAEEIVSIKQITIRLSADESKAE